MYFSYLDSGIGLSPSVHGISDDIRVRSQKSKLESQKWGAFYRISGVRDEGGPGGNR
jgi:hypothetical protein